MARICGDSIYLDDFYYDSIIMFLYALCIHIICRVAVRQVTTVIFGFKPCRMAPKKKRGREVQKKEVDAFEELLRKKEELASEAKDVNEAIIRMLRRSHTAQLPQGEEEGSYKKEAPTKCNLEMPIQTSRNFAQTQ